MWSRVIVVPFKSEFLGSDQDKHLLEKLLREREGIFAWLVEGAFKYLQAGRLPELPQVCKEAVESYRNENDQLRRFMTDCLVEGDYVRSGDAYEAYVDWCRANNETPVLQRYFRGNLSERGVQAKEVNGSWRFLGYKLKAARPLEMNINKPWAA